MLGENNAGRYVWCVIGVGASLLMLGCSMWMNYLQGSSFGRTAERALLFGGISIVADLWKAIAPIFIGALWRARRIWSAISIALVWGACFAYAIGSALGFAATDRMLATGERVNLRTSYSEVEKDLAAAEMRHGELRPHRSAAELAANLDTLLNGAVVDAGRVRGTVAALSGNCTKPHLLTLAVCGEVARLREEAAVAAEAARLADQVSQLRARLVELRERGGTATPDPQSEIISGLSRGWISAGQVHAAITLLIGAIVELVSAFGLAGVWAYADATRKPQAGIATKRLSETAGEGVVEYLAERIQPGHGGVSAAALYADYERWAVSHGREQLLETAFLRAVDSIRTEHGLAGAIRKFGDRYFGIALSHQRRESDEREEAHTAGQDMKKAASGRRRPEAQG